MVPYVPADRFQEMPWLTQISEAFRKVQLRLSVHRQSRKLYQFVNEITKKITNNFYYYKKMEIKFVGYNIYLLEPHFNQKNMHI